MNETGQAPNLKVGRGEKENLGGVKDATIVVSRRENKFYKKIYLQEIQI